ncbi:MAG: 23S rRNA (guanosine(2251)-2'-O)-methyltransferase RlmB [Planctomycetota bacterium]|jgi:23S rRNA (guanosine2251-2'-O)-methyltransferase
MVGQNRRISRRRKQAALLGSHQKCWLWGRHTVSEALAARRWLPLELVLSTEIGDELRESVQSTAAELDIPVEVCPHDRLTQLCGARDHQGLLAKMPEYPYATAEDAIAAASAPAFFLILDAIQDPFNLGAICRVACVFGVDAIFVGSKSQVGITSQVARSSAGAVNRLTISRVDDLLELADKLQTCGVRLAATSPHADHRLDAAPLNEPLAMIIGNEGAGVRPELSAVCDLTVSIPQATMFDSLNAAVSTGIVCYEVLRQRSSPSGC